MKNFEALGIKKDFAKGLTEMGIIVPTQIQQEVIPVLLKQKVDLVGKAQTGTGKTAAYGLPLLHKVKPSFKQVQGLILCPTRELGQQIAKQLFKYTKYTDKIFTEAVYGGAPIERQVSALTRPTHIVVATPGRLIDLVKRKAVDLSHVKTVILDEADEMLSMGFKKELDKILGFLKDGQNKWLFSATLPEGIRQIINKHMAPDAVRIEISGKSGVNKNVTHQFLICEEQEKFFALLQFLQTQKGERGMVFCKTKDAVKKLEKQLIAKKLSAASLHGDLLQKDRDKVMRKFKKGTVNLLVATDIAARGLDIASLAFVVHYQLPSKDDYYVHRSGRTGRAGKEGLSLSLVTSVELKQLRYYEKNMHITYKQIRQVK